MKFKYIFTSHLNRHLSGVAKFNYLLSQRLKIPCIGKEDVHKIKNGPVLLSLKLADNGHSELNEIKMVLKYLISKGIKYDVFFHSFDSLDLEYELLEHCRRIFCSNAEIQHRLEGIDKPLILAWCPPLLNIRGIFTQTKLNLFSFGMAHKIQIKYYKMLKKILEKHKIDYSLWVSTAFHEKANFGDFDLISNKLSEIFGRRIRFLGFLSDEAVNYSLRMTQLFIAFFEKGVRANNTSVYAAMIRRCVVLTNCDEHSPVWMKHRKNILDIHKIKTADFNSGVLQRIRENAIKDAQKHAGWKGLIALLSSIP